MLQFSFVCFSLCRLPVQELPEIKTKIRSIGAKPHKVQAAWRSRVMNLVTRHSAREGAEKVKVATGTKGVRLSAYYFMRGLDHGLQFVCGGLSAFALRPGSMALLKRSERRYMVDAKRKCPFEVPPHVVQKRCCVINDRTKATRFELALPKANEVLSLLGLFGDEGPRDLPAFWHLPAKFRALGFMDPLHRVSRDMCEAATHSNMWAMVLDTTCCLNCDHKPFLSDANFARSVEAISLYMDQADASDELFLAFFEPICKAQNLKAMDYSSPEQMKAMCS